MPPERRAVALGAWGGIAGLAIAIGPLVGGAIAEGVNWHWIFWLNVPIGIVAIILSTFRLEESYGPDGALDLSGLGLVSGGLFALVWGVIHGNELGWTDPQIVVALAIGAVLMAAVRRLGVAHRVADAAAALLPQPRLHAPPTSSRS